MLSKAERRFAKDGVILTGKPPSKSRQSQIINRVRDKMLQMEKDLTLLMESEHIHDPYIEEAIDNIRLLLTDDLDRMLDDIDDGEPVDFSEMEGVADA